MGDGGRVTEPYGAVLLIAYGGPDRPADIRPYLANVLRGRRVPQARIDEVAHHYELFGGHSPLTELTRRQAAALEAQLRARGRALSAHVGMRNWTPYLADALAELSARGVRRAVGVIMAPQQSYSSWEQYQENVEEARAQIGAGAPTVEYIAPWFDRPGFIEAQADRLATTLAEIPASRREAVPVVFTAHSIPVRMADASPYVAQVTASARLVAERLAHPRWSVAYQSRSGDPRDPWLDPDVRDVIRGLAADGVREIVTVPIGFVSDHIEVLYDLDTEARETAAELALGFHRAGTVLDHPAFIGMLADQVERLTGRG
ncbi:MAG TPA: ferrochelatase [bacterium]|nr:ferrochelatase [bacterium]